MEKESLEEEKKRVPDSSRCCEDVSHRGRQALSRALVRACEGFETRSHAVRIARPPRTSLWTFDSSSASSSRLGVTFPTQRGFDGLWGFCDAQAIEEDGWPSAPSARCDEIVYWRAPRARGYAPHTGGPLKNLDGGGSGVFSSKGSLSRLFERERERKRARRCRYSREPGIVALSAAARLELSVVVREARVAASTLFRRATVCDHQRAAGG